MVQFVCTHPEHRAVASSNGKASDHLTVHQREWAYCARDARLEEHVWRDTGGIPVSEAERLRHREVYRETSVL